MTYVAVIVADAALAHQQEIDRNVQANVAHHLRGVTDSRERTRRVAQIIRLVTTRTGPPRPVGTLHDVATMECPEGGTNCRTCGDPESATACLAAGHCPHCGTRHGVAPDRIVARNGYELVPLPGKPRDDVSWDPVARAFV